MDEGQRKVTDGGGMWSLSCGPAQGGKCSCHSALGRHSDQAGTSGSISGLTAPVLWWILSWSVFSASTGELALPKSCSLWPAERAVPVLSFQKGFTSKEWNVVSGPQAISQLNTENLPLSMNCLGFSLPSTGPVPVSLLHLTALFLPTLLLPEGWLPETVKNNNNRAPKFNFSLSFCSYFPGHRKPYQEVAKWESGLSRANGDELQIWMVLQTLKGMQFTFGFAKWVCPTGTEIPSGWLFLFLFLFLTVIRRRPLADGEKSCLVELT